MNGLEIFLFLGDCSSMLLRLVLLAVVLYSVASDNRQLKLSGLYIAITFITVYFISLGIPRATAYYPSIRSLELFALSASFALAYKRTMPTLLVCVFAALVSFSIPLYGPHYITDIFLSIGIAFFVALFWYWLILKKHYSVLSDL